MESGRNRFAAAVTLAFLVLGGIGIARHEMWRDEMQAWLIPAGSASLGELIHNLRYEGHPALWHILLWVLTRVTMRPEAMQVLHLAISAAAVFVFARSAPFSRTVRALAVFGYFPLYEYTVISRNYGLGMLFLFAACALFPFRRRSYLPIAAALALLANSNPYAWLVAVAFAGTLVLEPFWDREVRVGLRPADAGLGLLLFGAGAAMAAAQMIPPPDGGFATIWFLELRPARVFRVLSTVARAWLPIPNPTVETAWNTNLLWHLQNWVTALIGVALIGVAIMTLRRSRPALVLFLSGTAALLAFSYLKYAGYARHHGFHFLLLLACLWIAREASRERTSERLLVALLAIQIVAGVWIFGQDLVRPFSAAQATAEFLRDPQYAEMTILGYRDSVSTPVAGYLGRPFYYPQSRSLGTYVLWNQDRVGEVPFGEMCRLLRRQVRQHREGVLLVFNQPPPLCGARLKPEELASFRDSLLPEEGYGVYRLRMLPSR
ncbi:MAG TPA: hypothetical protein VH394_13380 [Thermoanaerobaculia bacterium]|jgi:hypothetical protein|nr:hypothetical protein [Thermoanaerobaculia bacterium]